MTLNRKKTKFAKNTIYVFPFFMENAITQTWRNILYAIYSCYILKKIYYPIDFDIRLIFKCGTRMKQPFFN